MGVNIITTYCKDCGSKEIIDFCIERHEYWYYCNNCKMTWGDYCPYIPKEEFAEEIKDQGFPLDAERILKGEKVSEFGE